MGNIHPSAVVDPSAELSTDVVVGPYCVIGPKVKIGSGTVLYGHVTVDGKTTIGENNHFYQYSTIGLPPQDLSYKNEDTELIIGNNNVFREFCSIHRGTTKEDWKTTVGNNCFFMSYVHIAHDVIIGNNVLFVNSVQCAGHVKIYDYARISGATNISQFVSIGQSAFIGGGSAIDRDIPDFCTAYGNRIKLKGINIIGLKRAGYSKQDIAEVVEFYRSMESSALSPRVFIDHPDLMDEFKHNSLVVKMADFIRRSQIGIAPFWS
jgi:UDP-N-acetylglucosamine acyltransferase